LIHFLEAFMTDKPEKIDWKKRLEAMKNAPPAASSQPVVTSPEPPVQDSFTVDEIPTRPPESEPEPKSEPESNRVQQVVSPGEISPEPPTPVPDPRLGRLDDLARQIRSLKIQGSVALVLVLLILTGLALKMNRSSAPGSKITADNLTIKGPKGLGRAWIGERDGQVRVEFRDQAGKPRLAFGLDAAGEPRLTFYNKDQKILSEIVPLSDGQAGIELLNQAGESVATIPVQSPPFARTSEPQPVIPVPPPLPQPQAVPPEVPLAEQKPATKPEAAVKATDPVIFVANPGGKSYHLPSSPWVKNTPPDQLLKFSSAAEAEKAGFHPGRDCRPDRKN
jgi:hypothetical protein